MTAGARCGASVDGSLREAEPAGARCREVSVTAEVVAGNGGTFLAPLVGRLAVEYGVDPELVGRLGATVLESFAGARVQTFVPVLVEKRLRETLRGRLRPRAVPGVSG
jgi:hypothetical protein